MSLKAKIEAVIYAAEEPVTLLQLVGLLGVEAQAALEAMDARQGELALEATEHAVVVQPVEANDADALNAETLGTEVFAAVAPADEGEATREPDAPEELPGATPADLRARERRLRTYMRSLLDELIADYADSTLR